MSEQERNAIIEYVENLVYCLTVGEFEVDTATEYAIASKIYEITQMYLSEGK